MRTTQCINIMIRRIKHKFPILLLAFAIIFLNVVEPSVFVVYPLGIGHSSLILPKFKFRKLDNDSRNGQNILNATGLHLVYPLKEEVMIMTPTPMEEYQEISQKIATTINAPTEDNNEFSTTTTIPDATTDYWQNDMFTTDLGTTTISAEDTTILDFNSTTPPATTERPIPILSSDSTPQSLSIYQSIGPLKLVRKRMFTSKQYSEPISNIMNSSTTTKRTYVRRNKKISKHIVGEINKPFLFSTTKEPKRYTYQRRIATIKPRTDSESFDARL